MANTRTPSNRARILLTQAAEAAAETERQKKLRDDLIVEARDEGATWRAIAAAVGMTTLGTMNVYDRAQQPADQEAAE